MITNHQEELQQTIHDLQARIEQLEQASKTPADLPSRAKLEKLKFYRDEDRQEWNLISNRVSSYITSQSFLVSAYTIAMGNGNPKWGDTFTLYFPLLLATVGLFASFYAYPAISAARTIIELWHKKQGRLYLLNPDEAEKNPEAAQHDPMMDDFRDGRPLIPARRANGEPVDELHLRSLRFAIAMPWLFGITWIVLAGLVLVLRYVR